MTNATAIANLKESDGVLPAGGFPAYVRKHRAAPMRHVLRATDRRRDGACELGGYDKAEYNRRAEAFVEALLARAPADVLAHPFARSLAFAYASHRAVADARKAADLAAAVAADEAALMAQIEAVQAADAAALRARLELVPLSLGLRLPANDVTLPPTGPGSARWPGRDDYMAHG
jgi:hypothetical protein